MIQDSFLQEVILARLLMSDEDWVFFEAFILAIRGRGGRPASNHRRVLDGFFWIARTGAQWRDLPEEFGKWSSVYRQFRRWTLAGLWELILESLNDSGAAPPQVQMIDSTVTRVCISRTFRNSVSASSCCPRALRLEAKLP